MLLQTVCSHILDIVKSCSDITFPLPPNATQIGTFLSQRDATEKQFWGLTFQHCRCLNSPGEELSFLISCTISNVLHKAYCFTQLYTPDLIPAWSSCSLHLSHPSESSCGLVKTQSPSLDCRALQSHFRPSEGPYWGRTEIYPPLANPSPTLLLLLLLHHFLHRSSSPLERGRGTGHSTLNWSVSAFVCNGNLGCVSMAKRRRWSWWSHAGLGSVSLCFSRYICWPRGRPLLRPRWRRGRQSKRTSRSCSGSSCPRLSCHWDLRRCWRCRRWCRWCCSGLRRREVRQGESKKHTDVKV